MHGLLKKNDKKTFEAFFHEHKDAVYRYAHSCICGTMRASARKSCAARLPAITL